MSEAHVQRKSKSKQTLAHRPPTVEANPAPAPSLSRPASARLGAFYAAGPVLSLGSPVQAKVVMGQANDPYEQEADTVAERVMAEPQAASISPLSPGGLSNMTQRQDEEESEPSPGQPKGIKRQTTEEESEEPTVQGHLMQRQATEEEEPSEALPIQTMLVQRQAADEEPEEEPEEGSVQPQWLQRQPMDEEEKESPPGQLQLMQRQADEEEEAVQTQSLVQRQTEEEGDELAQPKPMGDRVFTGRETPIQAKGTGAATSQVSPAVAANIQALQGGGHPLPQATRAFFEPRLGADFSQVRVHTDSRAAATSTAIRATAFTVGQNIAFGPGQYAPHSHEGRRLLAHELTHVVQQNGRQLPRAQSPERGDVRRGTQYLSASTIVQTKNKQAKPVVFYQEILDDIAKEEKQVVKLQHSTIGGFALPFLRQMLELSKAVEAGNKAVTEKLINQLVSKPFPTLAPYILTDKFYRELASRTLLIGAQSGYEKLKQWFLKGKADRPYQSPWNTHSAHIYLAETVAEKITNAPRGKTPKDSLNILQQALIVLTTLRDERAGLDEKKIIRDQKVNASIRAAGGSTPIISNTISKYYVRLGELIREVFAAAQVSYQHVFDGLVAELEKGAKPTHLTALKNYLNDLTKVVESTKPRKNLASLEVEVTKSEFKSKGSRHLDFFLKGRAAKKRSVGFEFYDQEVGEALAEEKKYSFAKIIVSRYRQLQFLERLYGHEKDKSGKPIKESLENKAIIDSVMKGKMRLNNSDDWRKFILAKFKAREKAVGRTAAFKHILTLLEFQMRAFTTHSPYNIDDYKDNYLSKTFPRDLTGRLIHDCGVYALRIVYILSLVRTELNLKFRFVILPLHVGLVITGEGLPYVVAHNDSFTILPLSYIAKMKKKWRETTKTGDPRKPIPFDEEQFLGEIASPMFIFGVDMPFVIVDVPPPKISARALKKQLWNFYKKTLNKKELFSKQVYKPDSPHYQFQLRYLEVLEQQKQWFNNYMVPYWNHHAHKIWLKDRVALLRAFKKLRAAKIPKGKAEAKSEYQNLIQPYMKKLNEALKIVEAKRNSLVAAKIELSADLAENPSLLKKGAKISPSERLDMGDWVTKAIYDYFTDLMGGYRVKPPFATKDDFLWPMD